MEETSLACKITMKEQGKFIAYMKLIWPTVYRIINDALYFIFSTIRAGIKIAVDQIKGKTL